MTRLCYFGFTTQSYGKGWVMLYAVIVGSEVMFWVFLFGGLAARYLLRRKRLSSVLLICAPLVDLVTLTAAVIDLRGGAAPGLAHVLAAIYIGVSVGFGHSMVHWADVRFAHRFADGPAPAPKPSGGAARVAHERRGITRHLVAWAVGGALLIGAGALVGTSAAWETFGGTAAAWTLVLVIDALWTAGEIAAASRRKPA